MNKSPNIMPVTCQTIYNNPLLVEYAEVCALSEDERAKLV